MTSAILGFVVLAGLQQAESVEPDAYQKLMLEQVEAHKGSDFQAVYELRLYSPSLERFMVTKTEVARVGANGFLKSDVDGKPLFEHVVEGRRSLWINHEDRTYRRYMAETELPQEKSVEAMKKTALTFNHGEFLGMFSHDRNPVLCPLPGEFTKVSLSDPSEEGHVVLEGLYHGEGNVYTFRKITFDPARKLILGIASGINAEGRQDFDLKLLSWKRLEKEDKVRGIRDVDLTGFALEEGN